MLYWHCALPHCGSSEAISSGRAGANTIVQKSTSDNPPPSSGLKRSGFPTNISSQNPTTEKKTQEMRICCHTWVNRQPTLKSRRFKFWGSRQSRGTAAPTLTFQRISVEIGCWLSHQRKYHHTYHQDGSFNGEKMVMNIDKPSSLGGFCPQFQTSPFQKSLKPPTNFKDWAFHHVPGPLSNFRRSGTQGFYDRRPSKATNPPLWGQSLVHANAIWASWSGEELPIFRKNQQRSQTP